MSMEKLKQEVAEAVTVMGSAAALIVALRARVKAVQEEAAAAGVDLPTLHTLATDLDTNANALAEAMKENTEAAAEAAPAPEAPPADTPTPVDPDAGAGEQASGDATPPAEETSST
jgi:hypothetical protein